MKEFEILHLLNHPCICKAIGINIQESVEDEMTTIAIYIEFIDFKLRDCLKSGFINNTLKTQIIVEISHGMKYLHSKNLIYRDLKIDNIMLNSVFQVKLIDFGLAKINEILLGDEFMSTYSVTKGVGSENFMSPEMINSDDYDSKTDVYSFGFVLYYIFVGKLPEQNIKDIIAHKIIKLPKQSPSISQVCIDLMSKCLSFNPDERPSFEEIIQILLKSNFMLAFDVDPTIVSKRDEELELIINLLN